MTIYHQTALPPKSTGRIRLGALIAASLLLLSIVALALLPIAAVTLFRARRLYAAIATRLARAILWLWGVRLVVHQERPFPVDQTIYVSNHTSSLDLFILVALGLPNTRFFLSGFVRKYVPLGFIGYLMGTFFTVPKTKPSQRGRIFQRANRTLGRTGESVYLSPEGERVRTGQIGHFNKGAFRLAISLKAPIVPLYIRIPAEIDPGRGYDTRPGTVHVDVKPLIDTRDWRLEDVERHTAQVRDMFVGWHRENRGDDHAELSNASPSFPAVAAAR